MSDYPQILGPHVINLPNLESYRSWMRTHFEQIPDPGDVWIFNIHDEGLTTIKVGDGFHMFCELKSIKDDKSEIKYYRISETDLRELLTAAHYAWALENGGVDNLLELVFVDGTVVKEQSLSEIRDRMYPEGF